MNHARRLVWQLLGRVWQRLRWRRLARIDPELEGLAERAFAELREASLIRPTRDIAESVRQRLLQRAANQPRRD